MIYVMSDVHGRLDLFEKMLNKINLTKDDKLFILGDMIDRGGDLSLLLKIRELQNEGLCIPIMGNHERLLLQMLKLYTPEAEIKKTFTEMNILKNSFISYERGHEILAAFQLIPKIKYIKLQKQFAVTMVNLMRYFNAPMIDGYTSDSLNKMSVKEIAELKQYISSMPTGVRTEVNGKSYLLVHAGYDETKEKTDPEHKLNIREEFFMQKITSSEPITVVFGHTPTINIRAMKEQTLKFPYTIWHDDEFKDKIAIDCGACYPHGQLACLCLDTMEEIYVKNDMNTLIPFSRINTRMDELKKMVDDVNAQYAPDIEHEISIFK